MTQTAETPSWGSLRGRVALVTGAGRGIGRAVAEHLARVQVKVVLVARTTDEIDRLRAEIDDAGGQACSVTGDVGLTEDTERIVDQARSVFGQVDILVNNAALAGPLGPVSRVGRDEWARTLQVNLIGPVRLTLALLPEMIDRGWGRILNMSSGAAAAGGVGGQNAYATSKGGLETHTLKLALELEGTGVTANALRPGASDTPMQTWMREQDPEVVGPALAGVFEQMHRSGLLKDAAVPADRTLELLAGDENGAIVEMIRTWRDGELVDVVNVLRSLG